MLKGLGSPEQTFPAEVPACGITTGRAPTGQVKKQSPYGRAQAASQTHPCGCRVQDSNAASCRRGGLGNSEREEGRMEASADGKAKRRKKKKEKKKHSPHQPFPFFSSTTHSTGLPTAFLVLSLTYHCRLRISRIRFTRANSHTASHAIASNAALRTSRTTLLLGKLHQGHIHSPVHVNPLCSERSDYNSHPLGPACQQSFSNLERLQR